MNEQVIAFLLKYQEMRIAKNEYQKNANRILINKVMKLELELDEMAPKILAALTQQ
jgi:hypothetical protein